MDRHIAPASGDGPFSDGAPVAAAPEPVVAETASHSFATMVNDEVPAAADEVPADTDHDEPVAVAPAAVSQGLPAELQPHTWWQWVGKLKLAGLPMAIARNSALIRIEGNHYFFDVDPVQGALFNDGQQQRIQDALREWIPDARVDMVLQATRGETPEQRRQRQKAEAHYGAKQAIEGDPLVQRILSEFGGVVVDDTVRPAS